MKKDSLTKKLLEKNMKSNVNILVFWANIEQLFRNFQHFFFKLEHSRVMILEGSKYLSLPLFPPTLESPIFHFHSLTVKFRK